jgi:ABC-type amino acid transport substrate-binding protein
VTNQKYRPDLPENGEDKMNKKLNSVLLLILTLLVAISLFRGPSANNIKETAFERVQATGTIRCGYFLWPPYLAKDANTKKLSGINYEIMEALGKNLGLKVEWVAEIGVGDVATALNTHKVDTVCSSIWPSPGRAQNLTLSLPTFYTAAFAFSRADDTRFDGDLNKANNKDIKVSGIDGDYSYDLAKEKLPSAIPVMLPQTASGSEILMQVVSKKADIVFSDLSLVNDFVKNNPNSLRQVVGIGAVRNYGETLAVRRGEYHLKNMLDTAIMQLANDGALEKIVQKYRQEYQAEFYAPSKAFVAQ